MCVVHLTRFSLLEEGEAQYHQLQGRRRLKEVVQVDGLWRLWMVECWDNFFDLFLAVVGCYFQTRLKLQTRINMNQVEYI